MRDGEGRRSGGEGLLEGLQLLLVAQAGQVLCAQLQGRGREAA